MTEENNLPQLPKGWVWAKFGEILGFEKGKKPKKIGAKDESMTVPYVDIEAFENGIAKRFTDAANCPRCTADDILIVWDGARCGLVGRGTSGAIGSTLAKLICYELNSSYIFYFLQSKYKDINSRPRGVGIPHVEPTLFWNIHFPLPPLSEQGRIVAKVEELFTLLDAGVESLLKVKRQLKRYRQVVLKYAFEGKITEEWRKIHKGKAEPAQSLLERIEERKKKVGKKYPKGLPTKIPGLSVLPEEWGVASVEFLSESVVDCLHSTPSFAETGKYCIDTNCIEMNRILFGKARFVSEETFHKRVRRLEPKAGDILFAREGTIGTAAVVPENVELCLGQRMMMFRPEREVIPSFFMWSLLSPFFEEQWKMKITGSTVPHINVRDIKSMFLPFPSLEEQKVISDEVERSFSITDELSKILEKCLLHAEYMRGSILRTAFRGKLVPQDATDEPAEKLLERIKQEKARHKLKEDITKEKMNNETPKEVGLMRYVK